jgi:hypothetical protein
MTRSGPSWTAADEHMDMGVLGVPMIDRDPVETGSEVVPRVLHQFAREGSKVGHLAGILQRDGEPEMMPVLFVACGESLRVGVVGGSVEHPGVCAIAGHAVPLEVGEMLQERHGAKLATTVTRPAP